MSLTDWNSFLWHFPTLRINHVNKLVSHYQNSPTMCNAEKRELAAGRGWKSSLPWSPATAQWSQVTCHEATACLLTLTCRCWSSRAAWAAALRLFCQTTLADVKNSLSIQGCNWSLFSLSMDLSIIFSINRLVVSSIKCQKVVKNVDHCLPKPKVTSSNVLFCPQPKDIQFTVTED